VGDPTRFGVCVTLGNGKDLLAGFMEDEGVVGLVVHLDALFGR
jgi:hypothetical protein